jgi:ankyrin repeat protein
MLKLLNTKDPAAVSSYLEQNLTDIKSNPNQHLYQGKTALHLAVECQDFNMVRELLHIENIWVNQRVEVPYTNTLQFNLEQNNRAIYNFAAIHFAVSVQATETSRQILTLLIQHGANVNLPIKTSSGRLLTPLTIAIEKNNLGLPYIQTIITSQKVKIDDKAVPPLFLAANYNIEVFKEVLKIPDIKMDIEFKGKTILSYLAAKGLSEQIKHLLEQKKEHIPDAMLENAIIDAYTERNNVNNTQVARPGMQTQQQAYARASTMNSLKQKKEQYDNIIELMAQNHLNKKVLLEKYMPHTPTVKTPHISSAYYAPPKQSVSWLKRRPYLAAIGITLLVAGIIALGVFTLGGAAIIGGSMLAASMIGSGGAIAVGGMFMVAARLELSDEVAPTVISERPSQSNGANQARILSQLGGNPPAMNLVISTTISFQTATGATSLTLFSPEKPLTPPASRGPSITPIK